MTNETSVILVEWCKKAREVKVQISLAAGGGWWTGIITCQGMKYSVGNKANRVIFSFSDIRDVWPSSLDGQASYRQPVVYLKS